MARSSGISLIAVLSGITGAMSPAAYGKSAKEVFAEVSSGIVVVVPMNLSGSEVALGSGVVVSKSHVATNCHVISGARQIAVRQAADAHARVTHRMMAKLTAQYPERDLCLLFVAGLSNSPALSGAGGLSRAIPVEWVNELTQTVEAPETRLAELRVLYNQAGEALSAEQTITRRAREQLRLRNLQIAALHRRHQQLARIETALEVAEREAGENGIQIVNLSQRLNAALAGKVQELASFRSEFFGRLRQALGNRSDVRIVGDRFVFQSEVLFPSGAATLQPGGRDQIDKLAQAIKELSDKIPTDINWVLRVDGHTDRIPISTLAYPSNWELSTGRAAAVVKYLIEQGVPAARLAATGFGEFQPIDPGNTIAAFRRNRRIEFKLTLR